jgi:pSer/pThr/pTyr-binding forkhead associated (FHA) protein
MSAQFQLVVRSGPNPGKTFLLSKNEMYVGRDVTNEITISDAEISRKHARLTLQGNTIVLEDLGSTNGTFVNGQRLMGPHTLQPGELVMFGENVGVSFEFVGGDASATVVGASPVAPRQVTPEPPASYQAPQYAPPQQVPAYQPPAPAYAQQVPLSPIEQYPPAPIYRKKSGGGCGKWILAGCGCLVILIIFAVVGAFVFDALDLYCKSPFDQIFKELVPFLRDNFKIEWTLPCV